MSNREIGKAVSVTGGRPVRGAIARGVALGVLAGIGWAVLARVFMRLITTGPEFSWVGTMLIVALSVVFWVSVGVVSGARASGRSRWWRLAGVPAPLIFASQGLLLLPGAALVAMGLAARVAWQRALLVGAGLGGTYVLLTLLDDERVLQPRTQSLGFVLAAACAGLLGVGLHLLLRRWLRPDAAVVAEASRAAYVR